LARTPKTFNKYLRLSTVGLELGFSVILGLFIGQYLDGLLGTEPWLLLLFLLLGAAAGFRRLYRLLKEVGESSSPSSGDKKDSP
jgi:ATP synthase protein I